MDELGIKEMLQELKEAIHRNRADSEKLTALEAQLRELAIYQKTTSKNLAKVTENLDTLTKDMGKFIQFEGELTHIKARLTVVEEHKDRVVGFLTKAFATLIIAGAMYGFVLSRLK